MSILLEIALIGTCGAFCCFVWLMTKLVDQIEDLNEHAKNAIDEIDKTKQIERYFSSIEDHIMYISNDMSDIRDEFLNGNVSLMSMVKNFDDN